MHKTSPNKPCRVRKAYIPPTLSEPRLTMAQTGIPLSYASRPIGFQRGKLIHPKGRDAPTFLKRYTLGGEKVLMSITIYINKSISLKKVYYFEKRGTILE